MSDFHDNKKTKAKKRHRCELCGQRIAIGEAYIRSNGVCEGDFYSSASHPECWDAFSEEAGETGDWEIYPGEHPRPVVTPCNYCGAGTHNVQPICPKCMNKRYIPFSTEPRVSEDALTDFMGRK